MHNYKIALFLTLMGCCYQMASANEDCSPPDWFNDESFLTQSGYYVSVGKGSSLKTAEDDALAGLGRTVSSEISSRIIIENKLTNSDNKSYSQEEVKDKRYKKGIRIGYPLKTERNYAPIRTDPPHSGPINPESGPRAGGATAPILRVRKILFDQARGTREPWQYAVDWLLPHLGICFEEMETVIATQFQGGNFTWEESEIVPHPVGLYRIEFYSEWPIGPNGAESAINQFSKSIAPMLGAAVCQNSYTREGQKDGLLRRWNIAVRNTAEYKKRYNEETFLKLYDKGDFIRAEVTYIQPKMGKVYPPDFDELHSVIYVLGADAQVRLNKIHSQLNIPPVLVSSTAVFDAIKRYGIHRPENKLNYRYLVQQLVDIGAFDPYVARLQSSPCIIDARTLREKLAHKEWGILEKDPKEGRNGPSTKSVYRLRPGWKEAAERYGAKEPE